MESHSALGHKFEFVGDDKTLFGPKHNIYTFFMIQFGLFVCQIGHDVNCETENLK